MTAPPVSDELCVRLGELLAKATPGRWWVETEAEPEEEQPEVYVVSEQTVCDYTPVATMGRALAIPQERKQADAALIAEMHEHLPTLLAERAALQARVAEAEGVIEPFAVASDQYPATMRVAARVMPIQDLKDLRAAANFLSGKGAGG